MVIGGSGMDPKANLFVRDEEEDENNHPNLIASQLSNNRDGFESQLQIQIGPSGGKILACRRRSSNEGSGSSKNFMSHGNAIAMQQKMNEELIAAQLERKNKLEDVLSSEKIRLVKLRNQVLTLRSRLQLQRSPELERLRAENKKLMMECEYMTDQVDMYNNGSIPLGETSEEFYRDIYPGQDANALVRNSSERGRWSSGRGKPPPRPPPPRILALPRQKENQSGEWCCSMCTFRNHPDLSQCEQCQMVRVQPSYVFPRMESRRD
ncbi:unnamed protein product [Allacma fusca]|uniref:RanBP2-type domain-containing protein n=1 Tax=Allacma fusca TaxID=39272 RepID=A0A8J2NUS4_9HEXA|nr:unnamed protein product [Allacma fusca]